MWANAQRDGRPAEYNNNNNNKPISNAPDASVTGPEARIGGALCSTPQFG